MTVNIVLFLVVMLCAFSVLKEGVMSKFSSFAVISPIVILLSFAVSLFLKAQIHGNGGDFSFRVAPLWRGAAFFFVARGASVCV
jgi:hypothetical protein